MNTSVAMKLENTNMEVKDLINEIIVDSKKLSDFLSAKDMEKYVESKVDRYTKEEVEYLERMQGAIRTMVNVQISDISKQVIRMYHASELCNGTCW